MLAYVLLSLLFLLIIKYAWKRRWLYYYSSKLEGPFSWPIIGSAYLFLGGQKEFYKKITKLLNSYSSVFKMWLGQYLLIVVSEPSDLEIILNICREKGKILEFGKDITREGLVIAPVPKWKKNRKLINPTLNSSILNSLTGVFNRHSEKLVKTLENNLLQESFDISGNIFRCMLDITIETLADVDVESIKGQDNFIQNLLRLEALAAVRMFQVWYHPDFFFKNSSIGKEFIQITKENNDFVEKIVNIKKYQFNNERNEDDIKNKYFLNHLLEIHQTRNLLTEEEIFAETQTMMITSSETTALTTSMVLLVLSIRRDIQEIVKKELDSIFETDNRDVTLNDINMMIYLECVIKETLRLFPTIPIIIRIAEKNIELDAYTIPAGSFVAIPIVHVHKHPKFWKNPMEFNPDRFLNSEMEKRHRCTFIPFGYGSRNCIGMKYGMMSMKIVLSTLLRHYTFKSPQYKCLEDVELIFNIVAKPTDGYNVKIALRNNKCEVN